MSGNTLQWDMRLDFLKLLYNAAVHRAKGFSPSLLFCAKNLRTQFITHIPTDEISVQTYVNCKMQHIKQDKLYP